MGIDLNLQALAIKRGASPDWHAAAEAIATLEFATIWDTGDEYFNWDGWQFDAEAVVPEAYGFYAVVHNAQELLWDAASLTRGAMENDWPRQRMLIELPDHELWVAGGPDGGEGAGETFEAFSNLAAAGIAEAAGMRGLVQYWGKPVSERSLKDFSTTEQRTYRAVRAYLFCEADTEDPEIYEESFDRWAKSLDRKARLLTRDADPLSTGRSMMDLLEHTVRAVRVWSSRAPGPEDDRDVIRRMVEGLDYPPPRRRSLRRAAADMADLAEETVQYARNVADDPGQIAPELAELVTPLAFAIADLFRNLAPISPPRPLNDVWINLDEPKDYRHTSAMAPSWVATRPASFNYAAGRDFVSTLPLDKQWVASEDFAGLMGFLAGQYARNTVTMEIDEIEVFMTMDIRDGLWSIADAIRKLGKRGVLDAAGAIGWGSQPRAS